MIITGPRVIYSRVAKKLEVKPELVERIGNHIYEDLNKRVANFEDRELYMYKLGTFRFRKLRSERFLDKMERQEEALRESGLDTDEIQNTLGDLVEKKEKVIILLDQWNKIIEEKYEFKTKRNESIVRDLQEPKADMGGTQEQNI